MNATPSRPLPRIPQRTTPGFAFSMVDRALLECLGRRSFGAPEARSALEFFGRKPPECVYCGSDAVERWDHLVAVSKGGETLLGNLVPACQRCDDSKRDVPYEEWMMSEAKHSPMSRGVEDIAHRLERLRAYGLQFGFVPRPMADRLTDAEAARLAKVHKLLAEARGEAEALIANYRQRTETAP